MLSEFKVSVVLPAKDLARAKKFYTEKLGLKEMDKQVPGMLMFSAGGNTMLSLYETKLGPGEHTEAGFTVDNLDQVIEDLESKGVKMEQYEIEGLKTDAKGIVSWEGSRSAWLKDSEGNIIALNEHGK